MSIEISVEIEVKCNECERSLDAHLYNTEIHVEPCPDCLEEAEEKGFQRGSDDVKLRRSKNSV